MTYKPFGVQIILVYSKNLVQINFAENLLIFTVKNQPLSNGSLGKTNVKHCKILCRTELDVGPNTPENAVGYDSTCGR